MKADSSPLILSLNSSLTFLPLDALLIEEVQLPLSDEFFLSAIVVGGGGAAFFFRLRPRVVYDMMKGLEFINEYTKKMSILDLWHF